MIRTCLEPRCPEPAAYRGRCLSHSRQRERHTHQNKHIYNSIKWKRTRERQLHDHPLCECGEIATDVDHVVPIEQGGDIWSFDNLQSLCHPCHSEKTRRETSHHMTPTAMPIEDLIVLNLRARNVLDRPERYDYRADTDTYVDRTNPAWATPASLVAVIRGEGRQ